MGVRVDLSYEFLDLNLDALPREGLDSSDYITS